MRVPSPLKSIADQAIRSASYWRAGRAVTYPRQHHWRIAYASAKEVDSHLRLLLSAGAVNPSVTDAALGAFDQVRAMTSRLLNPTS